MDSPTERLLPKADVDFQIPEALRTARACADALLAADTPEAGIDAVLRWNSLMANQATWSMTVGVRFRQNTQDAEAKEEKTQLDGAAPDLAETRRVFLAALASPDLDPAVKSALRTRFGPTVMDRWEAELRAFDPSVSEGIALEQAIQSEAMGLTGSARVQFEGEERSLAQVSAFLTSSDRGVRRAAAEARWGWFQDHASELDDQFDRLVKVRHDIAQGLGRGDFRAVAYDRMRRTDYGPDDVATFRESIRKHVVPVATEIRARQAKEIGIESLSIFDEGIWSRSSAPVPQGDGAWLEGRAQGMFDDIDRSRGTRLGELFTRMRAGGLLDLESRAGKAGGGFCTFLPAKELPFIFANFNGTAGDVRVFTHEMGHAYQGWCSHRELELVDQRRCTSETAEIHSMSLEFLTWPAMGQFFGDKAAEFRSEHLAQQIVFLPYGCAIDHFQHEVYERPGMSPAERHGVWRSLEAMYLPWRNWDGVPHGSNGAAWQAQLHVYQYPFYYIDYVLAEVVALQLLGLSLEDETAAWSKFQALCELGGSRGFRELVKGAGLGDPFDDDTLVATMRASMATLGKG